MSTQSIKYLSRHDYKEQNEKLLLEYNDSYFLKKNFLIGEMPDKNRIRHHLIFNRILSEDSCNIKNLIFQKIIGKLEEQGKKPKHIERLTEALKIAQKYLKDQECTIDEAVECSVYWSEAAW